MSTVAYAPNFDLFTIAEQTQRARLLSSPLGVLAASEIVVDLFCGGDGATCGIERAGLVVHECVNHCPSAIATHAANHPGDDTATARLHAFNSAQEAYHEARLTTELLNAEACTC